MITIIMLILLNTLNNTITSVNPMFVTILQNAIPIKNKIFDLVLTTRYTFNPIFYYY